MVYYPHVLMALVDEVEKNMNFFNNNIVYAGMVVAVLLLQYIWSFSTEDEAETMRNKKRRMLTDIFFCVCIGLSVATLFRLFPANRRPPGEDSSVFLYIAERMAEGKTPYLDMFDHKGPILYWIEYLGVRISGRKYYGVWFLETLNIIVTVALMCKLGKIVACRQSSIYLAVLISIGVCGWKVWQGGNFTEEYALPWITFAACVFFSFFKTGIYSLKQIILLGSSFMVVFLLRANMVTVWVSLLPVTAWLLLKEKRYKDIGRCFFCFLTGIAVVLIPVLCYAVHMGCFQAMLQDYIIFNFAYTDKTASNISTLSLMFYFAKVVWPGTVALILSLFSRYKNQLYWFNAIFFLVSLFLVTMSGRGYFHYAIVLLPTFAIPLVAFFDKAEMIFQRQVSNYSVCRQSVMLMSSFLILIFALLFRAVSPGEKTEDPVVKYIQEHSETDDDVLILGNSCWFYLLSERKTQNRYFYQLPPAQISNDIYEDFLNELSIHPSELIVLPGTLEERDSSNLSLNDIRKKLEDLSYKREEYEEFEIFLSNKQ